MDRAISEAAENRRSLTLTVCPNWDDGCRCGEGAPDHRTFVFGADQDPNVSAREALLLVEAEQNASTKPVAELVGRTLRG